MIQDLIITKFGIYDKDRAGKPFLTKDSKPYKKVGIQVDYVDYDGKWLSHLAFGPEDKTLGLKVGDRVKLKITQNGEYLNFDLPNRTDLLEERVAHLERALQSLMGNQSQASLEVPGMVPDEDIPF